MPSSLTYYRAAGLDPSPMLAHCKQVHYASAFLFDLLPLVDVVATPAQDHVRIKDTTARQLFDEYLERDHAALGYQVRRVPVMPIQERCRSVVKCVPRSGIEMPRRAG